MQTIDKFNFAGKKAIVRVDFNVPLDENGKITDDTRIKGAMPTLKKILADGGSVIIMSHMGKPKKNPDMKYSLSQIVDAVSEQLGVKVKFAQNDLMGKWGLKESTGFGQPGAVHFDWEAKEGTALVINLPGADEPWSLTPEIAKMLLPGVLEAMLGQYLQDVSFLEDGNIIATYNAAEATEENAEPEPLWKSSSLNLAHYRVNESICQVYPSIEMIMRQVAMDEAGRSNLDMTTILNQLLANGVPVHFTPVENGETTVYIDLAFLKQFTSFLPMIPALIPDDNALKPMLVEVLNQLPEVLEKTTKLEIGLNLVKATEAK